VVGLSCHRAGGVFRLEKLRWVMETSMLRTLTRETQVHRREDSSQVQGEHRYSRRTQDLFQVTVHRDQGRNRTRHPFSTTRDLSGQGLDANRREIASAREMIGKSRRKCDDRQCRGCVPRGREDCATSKEQIVDPMDPAIRVDHTVSR